MKVKQQKGITLLALIITIVILIILAGVAISTIQNTDIIGYANNAGNTYKQKQNKEEGILGEYEAYLKGEYVPIGREGKTVQYDSNNDGTKEDWIILTDREGLVEIVSKNAMGRLTLGSDDQTVKVTTDLDGDGTIGDSGDKAIASYNNAITKINNYCKSLVTATDNEGVRSVGASIEQDKSGSKSYEWSNGKITVKVGDEYYRTDYEKMKTLGIVKTDIPYWLASRGISKDFDDDGVVFYFFVWYVEEWGNESKRMAMGSLPRWSS